MDTCSINANSIQITEKASDVFSKKNLKKNEVHETSTRNLMESSMDVSDTMEYSKVKVKKIMHSSTF
ncbi:hypothetical protein ALC60_02474 [Trachymyrmex zeteki]|uniref:Uncharacterized protein n=1 Tax=Mycetomoellerius zeteki TaxID=64791 RepID=A0A151XE52_9HYME|nr:hypothetical protein ALC60_02474 [Trachymyrmex zeteki]